MPEVSCGRAALQGRVSRSGFTGFSSVSSSKLVARSCCLCQLVASFLRNSALAVVGTAAVPSFLTRAAFGATENGDSPQAPGRDLPARRGRWTQHRRPSRRAAVLRHASQHQHSQEIGRSISMASSACIRRSRRFSRCGSSVISPSFMPRARPTPRARTSTPRTSWKPARPA